jgi:hypothetical protein
LSRDGAVLRPELLLVVLSSPLFDVPRDEDPPRETAWSPPLFPPPRCELPPLALSPPRREPPLALPPPPRC